MTTTSRPTERELTEPVDLCRPDGTLNPAAVGWSRQPLHSTALRRGLPVPGLRPGWGRSKRWEYWGVVTPTHVVGLTVSDLDYAGVSQLWVLDRRSGAVVDAAATSPFGAGTQMPDSLGDGPARARAGGLRLEVAPTASGWRLRGQTSRVRLDLDVTRAPEDEAVCVVVPWDSRRFQYTVKDLALPVSGAIAVDGEVTAIGGPDAWAVLDHGRGRWPYAMTWNWGAGSGVVDGVRLGLQLGGRWTQGTGSTENALVVDGRVHKIHDEVEWTYDRDDWLAPWRVRGPRVDVTFTPFHERVAVTNLGVVAGETHQCFGTWTGWAATDDGTRLDVDALTGWAEEAHNRW